MIKDKAMKIALWFIFLLLISRQALAAEPISISITSPLTNQPITGATLPLDAYFTSALPVGSVKAFIDNQELNEVFDKNVPRIFREIALPALSHGPHTLMLRVVDVALNIKETSVEFIYTDKPVITLISPKEYAFGTPEIKIVANAIDSDGDVTLRVYLKNRTGSKLLRTSTNTIEITTPIEGVMTVQVTAVDVNKARTDLETIVYGTVNPNWYIEQVFPGAILDANRERVLYQNTSGLFIADRDGRVLLHSSDLTGVAFLTSFGAIVLKGKKIYELDQSGTTFIDDAITLKVNGEFATYLGPTSSNPNVYRRNLSTRNSKLINREVLNTYSDISESGDVVYSKLLPNGGFGVYLNEDQIDPGGIDPVIAGDLVLYQKFQTVGKLQSPRALVFRDSSGIHQLTQFGLAPSADYMVRNGWIVYKNINANSFTKRSPSGEFAILDDPVYGARIWALGPNGEIIVSDKTLSVGDNPRAQAFIDNKPLGWIDLPSTFIFVDGRLMAKVGSTLMNFEGPFIKVRENSGRVLVSWRPTEGFFFEATSNLSQPNWIRISTDIVSSVDVSVYEVPETSTARFFRLSK